MLALIKQLEHGAGLMLNAPSVCIAGIRQASKKAGSSTRNQKGHAKPKHRGWRVQDGQHVTAGTILATQLGLRFHPGLNVGLGRNGTLFAIEHGTVMVTCEKFDPNWDHTWVQRIYTEKKHSTLYKKYFHVIPEPQHNRFKLVDMI